MNFRSIQIRARRWNQAAILAGRVAVINAALEKQASAEGQTGKPVLFFNASTRTHSLSLNSAFSLLASYAVRARGVPVRYLVCQAGMQQCMLGTSWRKPELNPPCRQCMKLSQTLFPTDSIIPLAMDVQRTAPVEELLKPLDLPALIDWAYDGVPYGKRCIPTLRWAMRKHHLEDTPVHRNLMKKYIISAVNLRGAFQEAFQREQPRALVLFNGITYPEAIARLTAEEFGVPVITHEVGLRPFSAFFTHQDATFRQVRIPESFMMGAAENAQLDQYLQQRWQGKFTMAGIQFWPEMEALPDDLDAAMRSHAQTVVVFPNVIFDTSQVHANVLFEHMFDWLDEIINLAERHPETLFIIRAHPDEDRPGKASRESVTMWAEAVGAAARANIFYYKPSEYVSSYELIRRAKFSLVYNSSIGLEASIMGRPLICAGRGRYTQDETVHFPATLDAYREQIEEFLAAEKLAQPAAFIQNARRFLYYELYHASLDLSALLEPYPGVPGYVTLPVKPITAAIREGTEEWKILADGILAGGDFVYPQRRT
ncbi:MAG: hypothetical protein JXA97_10080 [Anaerolineales bacterium]|nr:hypothetical protein [Anaerolineales bacterium]